MQTDALPILYTFRRCPYAIRARLAVAVSAQRCSLREVVLRDKPQAMLEASPKGTVPVLVLANGHVIDESLDIMLWALGRNDPEQWLNPRGGTQDDMQALIAGNDGLFKSHLDRYKYPNRFQLESGEADRDDAAQWLVQLDGRLRQAPWLCGQSRSLADMALAPFVRQYAHTDRDWFDSQPWPGLRRWLDQFLGDPLFLAVMKKYPPWVPGQADVVFAPMDAVQP